MKSFEERSDDFDRSYRRTGWFIKGVFVLMVVMAAGIVIVAHQAGCLRSMFLNGVCLSDPKLDNALKNVLGN